MCTGENEETHQPPCQARPWRQRPTASRPCTLPTHLTALQALPDSASVTAVTVLTASKMHSIS